MGTAWAPDGHRRYSVDSEDGVTCELIDTQLTDCSGHMVYTLRHLGEIPDALERVQTDG
jgi:hypothetical protein